MSSASRASRAPETGAGRVGRWLLTLWAVGGFVYLFVPIVVIVVFSFNEPAGRFNIIWRRFTLDNWFHAFEPGGLTDAMVRSLQIAAIAAGASTVLGGLMALALARYRFKGGSVIEVLLVLPLTTPEIVLGASLLALFQDLDWQRGFGTIVIAHILFCTSFVALTIKARVRGFDWTLEDAAMDLGAPPWRTFSRVTLPLITPGILAAALLSFALSIDDFIITYFNSGQTETYPVYVYGAALREISPQIHVLASIVLFASVGLLLAGVLVRARMEGRSALVADE